MTMTQAVVALFDDRPFFEKALAYGVQHGVLDQAKLDAIQTDAPKGMVQIARYFGSEFLRPELEKPRTASSTWSASRLKFKAAGTCAKPPSTLREHSFMSRSKAASDMLKALIVMPQNTHFGMNEHGGFSDKHIPQLAKWSLCNLAEYQTELAKRQQVAHVIDAAIWIADQLGLHADDLEEAGCDAEAVIRTALLAAATKHKEMPDWVAFQKSSPPCANLAPPKPSIWLHPKTCQLSSKMQSSKCDKASKPTYQKFWIPSSRHKNCSTKHLPL